MKVSDCFIQLTQRNGRKFLVNLMNVTDIYADYDKETGKVVGTKLFLAAFDGSNEQAYVSCRESMDYIVEVSGR